MSTDELSGFIRNTAAYDIGRAATALAKSEKKKQRRVTSSIVMTGLIWINIWTCILNHCLNGEKDKCKCQTLRFKESQSVLSDYTPCSSRRQSDSSSTVSFVSPASLHTASPSRSLSVPAFSNHLQTCFPLPPLALQQIYQPIPIHSPPDHLIHFQLSSPGRKQASRDDDLCPPVSCLHGPSSSP